MPAAPCHAGQRFWRRWRPTTYALPLTSTTPHELRLHGAASQVDATAWDALALQSQPTPFAPRLSGRTRKPGAAPWRARAGCRAYFISCGRASGCAPPARLCIKAHSYGEYVFDWAGPTPRERHGLPYLKAVVAVPFTPVPGSRLLWLQATHRRTALLRAADWARESGPVVAKIRCCGRRRAGHRTRGWPCCCAASPGAVPLLQPASPKCRQGSPIFDDFLASLTQDKRKKIRQRRRRRA